MKHLSNRSWWIPPKLKCSGSINKAAFSAIMKKRVILQSSFLAQENNKALHCTARTILGQDQIALARETSLVSTVELDHRD
eukprot:scaffold2830_cov131-Cylindrotheca_fusiformis.AAC.61